MEGTGRRRETIEELISRSRTTFLGLFVAAASDYSLPPVHLIPE
jgi:hypothetical protein